MLFYLWYLVFTLLGQCTVSFDTMHLKNCAIIDVIFVFCPFDWEKGVLSFLISLKGFSLHVYLSFLLSFLFSLTFPLFARNSSLFMRYWQDVTVVQANEGKDKHNNNNKKIVLVDFIKYPCSSHLMLIQ